MDNLYVAVSSSNEATKIVPRDTQGSCYWWLQSDEAEFKY